MSMPGAHAPRTTLPVFFQSERSECGIVCLAMISTFYGHHLDVSALRRRIMVSSKGMNLEQLLSAAQLIHFSGRALRLDLNEVGQLTTPCILHWDLNHFVVLKGVTRKHLLIHDPALGFIKISKTAAGKHFTGIAIEIFPTIDFRPRKAEKRFEIWPLIREFPGLKGGISQFIILSVAVELCAILMPLYMQWTVDQGLLSADRDLISLLALSFLILGLAQGCITALRSWIILNFGVELNSQWATNVFSHLLRLPQSYFENRHLGDVISRFDSLHSIQKTLTTSLVEALFDGAMACLMLAMMISYSGLLSSISIVAVLAYAAIRFGAYGPLRRASMEQIVLNAKQQTNFIESVRGIQAIKLACIEAQRVASWSNKFVDSLNRYKRTQELSIYYRFFSAGFATVENVVVVWIGAQIVLSGVFSVGMLFAYIAYKGVFAARVNSLVDKLVEVRMLRIQVDRLADIVLEEKESVGVLDKRDISSAIHVRSLSFRYTRFEDWILRDVSFSISPGSSVAIVGPSGCGKTTLAKILLGLLEPTGGEILFGGKALNIRQIKAFRTICAAVMQDDQLFSGSIAENISFFNNEPDYDRIKEVCRQAHIDHDIQQMPMKYDTLIGDMGTVLSGGQRQRILLARALYARPSILILDEATSHLDVSLEEAVNSAIKSLSVTRIVIAHRPQTIASCDYVIDLESINRIRFEGYNG